MRVGKGSLDITDFDTLDLTEFFTSAECVMLCPQMASDTTFREIERWLNAFPETDVERLVKELEQKLAALHVRADKIQDDIDEAARQLERSQRFLEVKRALDDGTNNRPPSATPQKKIRGKTAIFRVMKDSATRTWWSIGDVHEVLLRNGWVNDENNHTTQVNLSRMYRDGDLVKPRDADGLYALPDRVPDDYPVRRKKDEK